MKNNAWIRRQNLHCQPQVMHNHELLLKKTRSLQQNKRTLAVSLAKSQTHQCPFLRGPVAFPEKMPCLQSVVLQIGPMCNMSYKLQVHSRELQGLTKCSLRSSGIYLSKSGMCFGNSQKDGKHKAKLQKPCKLSSRLTCQKKETGQFLFFSFFGEFAAVLGPPLPKSETGAAKACLLTLVGVGAKEAQKSLQQTFSMHITNLNMLALWISVFFLTPSDQLWLLKL